MSCLLQKSSITIFIVYWLQMTNTSPLFQGFSIQKRFEVNLKPFEFKPISFFREKWSPFGRFGSQKGIHKRDLGTMTDVSNRVPPLLSPAPVFEQINENPASEQKEIASNTGVSSSPEPIKPIESNLIRIPLSESFKPPTEGLFTSIGRNLPVNNYILERPAEPVIEEVYGELPPRPVGPIPEPAAGFVTPRPINFIPLQPISPVSAQPGSPIPMQTAGFVSPQPVSLISAQQAGFNPLQPVGPTTAQAGFIAPQPVTPISAQPASYIPPQPGSPIPARPLSYIPASFGQTSGNIPSQTPAPKEVFPLYTPPPLPANVGNSGGPNVPLSEIPPTEGPLLRGSRVALYFGNVFLQLVSQFLANARLQFSQFKQPTTTTPPVFVSN